MMRLLLYRLTLCRSLEYKGQVIGNNDIMIAATALIRNATLVTSNTREFSRIDGLKLDDWTL